MGASEMYDFLSTISPDYSTSTLTISAQGKVSETSSKAVAIHTGVDGSEERISHGSTPIFCLSWDWNVLTESDSGTIFDLYNDSAKANGCQKSFKFTHGDGHTYVVRFDCELNRAGHAMSRMGIPGVKLRVLGRVADS